ncbi:2-C-methyl-D-erythritol 4-phosphate cytidylyltransferase [Hathewaya histolytica]|uniref:2-C-methyl-D-erythritol 4-phosphate cytidylyltransferase n=1 Tax=Hathewaya histolytica TaxID=1498 RepID=UPI003B6857CE
MMLNYAIILAAGKGRRMNKNINKQFLNLQHRPILYHTLKVFESIEEIHGLVLVASEEEKEYCKNEIVKKYNFKKVKNIVSGGNERQDSVLNGLFCLEKEPCNIVIIHDGARPFVTAEIIKRGIRYAKMYGASACGVGVKDTIKIKSEDNFSAKTLDRNMLFSVQTPQCFIYNKILDAHKLAKKQEIIVTDDTSVIEYIGDKVYLYEGSYDNIKITTPEDLVIGEGILENYTK